MKNATSLEELVADLTRLFAQMEAQAVEQSPFIELSMKQIFYLETIANMEGPTFTELAQALDLSKPSITALVKKLSHEGYVKTERSQADRRAYHIQLTAKGRKIQDLHASLHHRMAEYVRTRLSEKQTQDLEKLLRLVIYD